MKKKTFLTLKNPMVHIMRAGEYRIPKHGLLAIFCLAMVVSLLLREILKPLIRLCWRALAGTGAVPAPGSGIADDLIFSLLLTVSEIICVLIYVRAIENRPVRTAGMTARGCGAHYLIGLVAGFAVFSGAVGISWALGGLTYTGRDSNIPWGAMAALLLCWMIQGFSEEISFRGWLMTSLLRHSSPVSAVVQSALMFAVFHLGNPGVSVLAFFNLMLFGVFAAFWLLRTGSLWGPAAMHAIWNLLQGNFYGIKVSGLDVVLTVFRFDAPEGRALLNGGAFGMEGGIGVTAVLLIGIAILYFTAPSEENAEFGMQNLEGEIRNAE